MTPNQEKLRILVVSADGFMRALLESAAEESGMFVASGCAEDAYEALAQIWDAVEAGTLPEVVLLDYELPSLDGVQLARELRLNSETQSLYIAVLAQSDAQSEAAAARAAGVNYFGDYTTSMPHLVDTVTTIARRVIHGDEAAVWQ